MDISGNSYLVGSTESFGVGGSDIFLVKYNSSNALVWQRTWGGRLNDLGEGVAVDSSGNSYVTGYSYSYNANGNTILLRFNSSGNLSWQRSEGGGGGVAVGPSGSAYVIGVLSGGAKSSVIIERFDSSGSLIWDRNWSGIDSARVTAYAPVSSVASDPSGNVNVVGATYSYSSGFVSYAFLLHFDVLGNLLWQRVWASKNGASRPYDQAVGVAVNSPGEIYVAGNTNLIQNSGGFQFPLPVTFLSKYNSSGSLLWEKLWYANGESNSPRSIGADSSGNIYITGYTYPNNYLVKLNPDGIPLAQQAIRGTGGSPQGLSLASNSTSNVYIASTVSVAPPYPLCSIAGAMHGVNVTQNANGYPTGSPSISPTALTGNVTAPLANQAYAGASDAALLSYNPQSVGAIPTCTSLAIPPFLSLTTIILIAPLLYRARRRF